MLKLEHVSKTFHPGTPDAQKALDDITYSQDKSLLMMAYQKYRESIKD